MARKRMELTAIEQCAVDSFIARHLNPSPGRTPQDVKARILHWISIANNPSLLTPDTDAKVLANVRRKARQNALRLLKQHPELATQPMVTELPEVAQ